MYGSAPFAGKIADLRGPRLPLTLSFTLLLIGYLGTKAIYDAAEGNTEPARDRTLFMLMLCGLISGIGSMAGYAAALNVVAKSFPNKIVSPYLGFITQDTLTPLLDAENDRDGNHSFWCRIVGFHLFHDRTYDLPW